MESHPEIHTFDGLGATTLEIELLPGRGTNRGLVCRLIFESGHIETVDLKRRHARLLHHLVRYRVDDRQFVEEAFQGFRMRKEIAEDIAAEWFPIHPEAVRQYALAIRKMVRDSFARARRRDPTLNYVDPIEMTARFGVRLGAIPLRVIDHALPPSTEP